MYFAHYNMTFTQKKKKRKKIIKYKEFSHVSLVE